MYSEILKGKLLEFLKSIFYFEAIEMNNIESWIQIRYVQFFYNTKQEPFTNFWPNRYIVEFFKYSI